ncbi:MAG: PEP/pyruvate-binding domain-containing protein [Chloroflexi bacterium]|nr:PEP/pyruvate-binding domain-containing protein [Chloroflexota bacterium]
MQYEYPEIVAAHLGGKFESDILEALQSFLTHMGDNPIIVRSSSLLEDSFGTAFAGKYDSYFCPESGDASGEFCGASGSDQAGICLHGESECIGISQPAWHDGL